MTHIHKKFMTQPQLVEVYGINKYQLADQMRNSMHIPNEYLDALGTYHMVHWRGFNLAHLLIDGTITNKNIKYAVIYHGCLPVAAKKAQEIRLSFRAAKPEFGIEPIVLVQIVSDVRQENLK